MSHLLNPVTWHVSWRFIGTTAVFLILLFGGIRGHGALRGNKFGVWFLSLLGLAGLAIYFAGAR